jgi:hypothetical protein
MASPSGSSNQHRRANIGRFHVVHDVVMMRVVGCGVHANVAFRVMAMRWCCLSLMFSLSPDSSNFFLLQQLFFSTGFLVIRRTLGPP